MSKPQSWQEIMYKQMEEMGAFSGDEILESLIREKLSLREEAEEEGEGLHSYEDGELPAPGHTLLWEPEVVKKKKRRPKRKLTGEAKVFLSTLAGLLLSTGTTALVAFLTGFNVWITVLLVCNLTISVATFFASQSVDSTNQKYEWFMSFLLVLSFAIFAPLTMAYFWLAEFSWFEEV